MADLGLSTFNKLYPMMIRKYNDLIIDQNATEADKINQIIQKLNALGKLSNDVVRDWNTVYGWAMNDGLTTDVNNKLELMLANHEFDPIMNNILTQIGDLTTLQTTDKDTLVHAINDNVASLAQSMSQANGIVINANYPPTGLTACKGDGVTDDTTAIQALISYCVSHNYALHFPSQKYLISSTLNFQSLTVTGLGGQWQSGVSTQFITNTSGILMAQTNSEARLKNIVFNGNGVALWGLMASGVRAYFENVSIVRCSEYGLVANALQNSIFTNLSTKFNNYGLVLANGTRNCNFYNFTSSIETGWDYSNNTVNSRCILFLIDTSNPHSFGLSTSVTAQGNDRNNFFGGISEIFNNYSNYTIESLNKSGYGSQCAGTNNFYGYEFDGQSIFKFDSTFTGTFNLRDCAFIIATQTSPMTSGTGATLLFSGNSFFSGAGNLAARGITCNNNYRKLTTFNSNDYVAATAYSTDVGTMTFTAGTNVYSMSGGPGNGHQGIYFYFIDSNSNQVPLITAGQKPLLRITFNLANIVGATTVDLYAAYNQSPWRTKIGSYGVGANTVLWKCAGNEDGIEFAFNAATAFDVSDILIEIL